MNARDNPRCWVVLAAIGVAVAIIALAWTVSPLLAGLGILLAVGASLLHQRGARRCAERRLQDHEALIRVVVDGAIDAIMTVDSRGAVASFNLAAEHMFGWPADEMIGKDVDLLFAPRPSGEQPSGEPLKRTTATMAANVVRPGEREVVATHRDGSLFPVYLRCSRSHPNGSGVVTAIARDLTQYRQNAEALQGANVFLEEKVIELEERTRAITILGKMSDILQASASAEDAYAAIGEHARQLFHGDAGALCIIDPMKDLVEVVASWGAPSTRPVFPPAACRALHRRCTSALSSNGLATSCSHVLDLASVGHRCLPVVSQGEAIGIVHFQCCLTDAGTGISAAHLFRNTLAASFTEQVSLALTNQRLKETLRAQAVHDPLTGLANRRFLDEALHREVLRAARRASPVGVLMLDLDNFKEFNDAYGHAAGDALLCAFAEQLQREVRAADIACRFGGEEFAVILPDATLKHAMMRAEQIRQAMHKMTIDFDGQELAGVTVSIGVAACPEHGASPDALLRAADAALYAAKADGRNTTKLAAQILESAAGQASLGALTRRSRRSVLRS